MSNTDRTRGRRAPRPTGADVAKKANVSRATVSYVLNGVATQSISAKTREDVLKAAAELGYRPNLAARNLASGASGVILNVINDSAVGELGVAISSRLSSILGRYGLMQSLLFEEPDSKNLINAINDLRPVAVVSLFPLRRSALAALGRAKIPTINIQNEAFSSLHMTVGEAQVAHLSSRGHQKIAFARSGAKQDEWLSDTRCEAVRAACRARGLDQPLIAELAVDGSNAQEVVTRWMQAGITAVCAYNDRVAMIVQYGMRSAKLRCPEDLALIGADADPIGFVSAPPLTTIAFDEAALIGLSLNALLSALGYSTENHMAGTALVSLVQRASA